MMFLKVFVPWQNFIISWTICFDSEGSLLPRGSMVLVRGDMVGTVIYFGHRRHPIPHKGMQYLSPTSNHIQAYSALCNGGALMDDAGSLADVTSSPLGVTIALWSPGKSLVGRIVWASWVSCSRSNNRTWYMIIMDKQANKEAESNL